MITNRMPAVAGSTTFCSSLRASSGSFSRLTLRFRCRRVVWDADAAHQQPMRVDRIRRTGHQRHIVLPRLDGQRLDLFRQNHRDLIHLIGERLIQCVNRESVADLHQIQIAEQLGRRQTAVRREHRVGALAADGQGRAFYMADHLLQHVLIRAVCDGKPQIQLRDLDITHHAIAIEVEQRIVFRLFRLGHHGQRAPLSKRLR